MTYMEKAYNELAAAIADNAEKVEEALVRCTEGTDEDYGLIFDAERYSLLGGGKRIRPFIVNEVARALGGSLDVWSGKKRRAPVVMRACGLEWLWRGCLKFAFKTAPKRKHSTHL